MLIHTPNLRLLTCERTHLEAIVRDPQSLGESLGVSIPDGWPAHPAAYPHALELLKQQPLRPWTGWWLYLFILPAEQALVGCGGFKDVPDAHGSVEIGFDIAPAYRDRGLGAEAVGGLVRYAFTRPEVEAVTALTLPRADARAEVFAAAGLQRAGDRVDAEAGPVLLWRVARQAYEQARSKAA